MNFYTTILGSGAAIPTLMRHCSSQVLNINGFRMMLDCGEGTQNQVRVFHERLQSMALVCISHLHGDHFFGLPGLLSTMHLCGRTEPVEVVAPKGLKHLLEEVFTYTQSELGYELRIQELDTEVGAKAFDRTQEGTAVPLSKTLVFENKFCRVYAFPLWHSVPTFGYSVEEIPRGQNASRRYVYCSDTAYTEAIIPFIEGANLLCMESTFADNFAAVADEKLHMTASRAATLAKKAQVEELLLTHFSARYKTMDAIYEQASAIFPRVLLASDGERYPVRYGGIEN